MNWLDFLQFAFSSFLANLVVIALLAAMLVMAAGTLLGFFHDRRSMKLLLNGVILAGIFIALAAMQFGAIPVSFDGVSKLGLATIPAGPAMSFYETAMGYVLAGVGWLASLAIVIGAVMMIGSMGRNGMTLFLLGVIMAAIAIEGQVSSSHVDVVHHFRVGINGIILPIDGS